MNRIYAVFIMFYCWQKTHSEEFNGIPQYYAPESLHNQQSSKHNEPTPRLILSYQQILRQLMLPYHHQLPYCHPIPFPYHQNVSLHETSFPPQYLHFYFNSHYHQNPSYTLESPQYLTSQPSCYKTSYGQKPSSGFLLFYYNTFYHQNSDSHNHQTDNLCDTSRYSANRNQQDSWKTTPIAHQQEGWSYGRMLALTSKCIADKPKRTVSPGVQNLMFVSYNAFNSCVHSGSKQENTSACILLNNLVGIVKNGAVPIFFQNQTYALYNEELNGFSTTLNIEKLKSNRRECKKAFECGGEVLQRGDFSTKDWQHLLGSNIAVRTSKNEFSFARIPFELQQTKDYFITPKCPHISKLRNKTYYNEFISFTMSGPQMASNFSLHTQEQITDTKKYSQTTDHILDFQRQDSCPIKCAHAQMCCK